MSKPTPLAMVITSWSILATLGLASCKDDTGVGTVCDLGNASAASPAQTVVSMNAVECQTGVCLKTGLDPSKAEQVPPTGATCSAECSSDSDCEGELRDRNNPNDTRCAGGFVCGVPFVVGPLCCKKYCVCKDSLATTGSTTPIACQGPDARATCQAATPTNETGPGVEQETDTTTTIAPIRKLDLVFMIDNSPSMAPKIAKLTQQFPKLIAALADPFDGTYPDLRIAMIDSDLGTGGAYPSGSCAPSESNGNNAFGDLGNFQMRAATSCGMSSADSLWIEYTKGAPVNYNGDISQVFSCLASGLGTLGCGEEHQIQAFEFALAAPNIHVGRYSAQNAFLRPEAHLGLVLLSDEDDCSAATNDDMFGDKVELRGESASLRCATRGHQCNGVNLSDGIPGYPTIASFEADFAACSARTDACPNPTDDEQSTDTGGPTACSPLKDVRKLAQKIKALKGMPEDQILVAGIFGWPRMIVDDAGQPVLDQAGKVQPDLANAKYRIDLVPNPNSADTAHPQNWDYWPVCYDPDHQPATPGAFDPDAWGWGAQGGLRMSAFVDQFGANGLKYSVCERDYTEAMRGIGKALVSKIQSLCIEAKLKDLDLSTPGLQPDCRVTYRTPAIDPNTYRLVYSENPQPLPLCQPGTTPETAVTDCWQPVEDPTLCPTHGQLLSIVRTAAEIAAGPLPAGTQVAMKCRSCPALVSSEGCAD